MAEDNALLERALHLHRSGKLVEAAKGYRKFLRKNPSHPNALYLLGCLEYQSGKNGTATDLLLDAITLAPHEADYHNTLGLALTGLEKYDDAEQRFQRALQLENRAQFHWNFALLKKEQNRLSEASAHFQQALALLPDDTELLCDAADTLQDAADHSAAAALYQRALNINSQLTRAWYSAGCNENARAEFVPALACFQKAVDLQPDWLEARHNLARALYEIGQVTDALTLFRQCALHPHAASAQSRAMMAVIIPGAPTADNQAILEARRSWAQKDLPSQAVQAKPRTHRDCLRIGYVSSFFQRDNWMKPVWGLINQHDRTAFHITLFSDAPATAIQHGYRPHLNDRFFNTATLSNDSLANLIREAEIDVLIDLNGFSNMRRLPLFTYRPAPVIIGWFNMYATTGMNCFDYLIGDSQVIPPEEEPFYSENILRVPGSYLTFSVDYPVPPVAEPPYLINGFITFGSLSSQFKITNEVIAAWSRILQLTPNSRLLVKNRQLASPTTRHYLQSLFEKHSIPRERISLEGPADHYTFLQAYDRIDIALDPFPYNGGTTTTEALWQGVPVITFQGDRWASRTSASLLHAANLPEFVAPSLDAYISLASHVDPDRLLDLRRSLRHNLSASSVCNTRTFATNMEDLYRGVHKP